ncbi:hypothetical protein, partial [Pantoea septica]|uniref:hypothetical protein n=1 Tax=Pantoea septica TaxID=472695 RepID=UPI0028994F78
AGFAGAEQRSDGELPELKNPAAAGFFVAKVQTRIAWSDRKVAQGIPARSARDIHVAGRFALRSTLSTRQVR